MPYKDLKKRKDFHKKYYENHKEEWTRYSAEYRVKNAVHIQENSKKYTEENKEKIKEYQVKYRSSPVNIKKRIGYDRLYKKANRKRTIAYVIDKKKTDIQFKLQITLRNRLLRALNGNYKVGSAVRDLGCSVEELKIYLENKFEEGMCWKNHGMYGWHIDHNIPLAAFDLTDREQFLQAVHYTNLQPMWALENIKKSNKVTISTI